MDKVYVVSAVRTAVGKSKKGALAQTRPDDMAATVIKAAIDRAGVKPEAVEDVVMGCAFPEAEQGMNVARIATIRAGVPESVLAVMIAKDVERQSATLDAAAQ